tara:strand:+ start:631 stop:930 length:300 start_codon:yes stop_codon:yes gene_type:complete
MENFIIVINIILAVLLVLVILLQKSEGGALGIGVSQDSFITSRSAGNILTKTTAILAALFIFTSISLTVMSKDQFSTTSVLEKVEEKSDPSEPEIPKSD